MCWSWNFVVPFPNVSGNIFSLVIATRPILVSCADMAGDTDVSTMEAYSLIACKRMLRDFLWS